MTEALSIIDSHAHLDYPQFADQLPEVIERAAVLGVTEMISIGVRLDTADKPRQIAEKYENIWFSGVFTRMKLQKIRRLATMKLLSHWLAIRNVSPLVRQVWIIFMILHRVMRKQQASVLKFVLPAH